MAQFVHLETLCSLLTNSLSMQISTLVVLGRHPMRPELIVRAKETARAALTCLEKFEEDMTTIAEGVCEKSLQDSALAVKGTQELVRHVPEDDVFKEMQGLAKSYHSELTAKVSDKEQALRSSIAEFFDRHRARIEGLVMKLDKL